MNENPNKCAELNIEEYKCLREELLAIYARQQKHIIETLIVIGALVFFFYTQISADNDASNDFLFFIPAVIIPMGIYAIVVQAQASFLRGCKIHLFMSYLKKNWGYPVLCDDKQYYSWSHWYATAGTSWLERMDLGSIMVLLPSFAIISVVLAFQTCNVTFVSLYSNICLLFNGIFLVLTILYALFVKKEHRKYRENMNQL